MRRGTTPTIVVTVDGDITQMDIYLTFKCGRRELTKTGADLDVSTESHDQATWTRIECKLTQDDTLDMQAGQKCEVQVRACSGEGTAIATTIGSVPIDRILKDGVIGVA